MTNLPDNLSLTDRQKMAKALEDANQMVKDIQRRRIERCHRYNVNPYNEPRPYQDVCKESCDEDR